MTRDEAITIEVKQLRLRGIDINLSNKLASANIDALIELGLLKVDKPEPKTAGDKLIKKLIQKGFGKDMIRDISEAFYEANVKVINND